MRGTYLRIINKKIGEGIIEEKWSGDKILGNPGSRRRKGDPVMETETWAER